MFKYVYKSWYPEILKGNHASEAYLHLLSLYGDVYHGLDGLVQVVGSEQPARAVKNKGSFGIQRLRDDGLAILIGNRVK